MLQLVETPFQAIQGNRLSFHNINDPEAQELDRGFLITKNPLMESLTYSINVASQCDLTVLITGETGTGKRLVGETIHKRSSRSDMPLVIINCASLSNELIDSELFGHKKGSFSSAYEDRVGLFEAGNGSTVVIDEINALSLEYQAKLLRVLEERKIRRLGLNGEKNLNIRVIAITNQDLVRMVKKESFRKDLYYRINVLKIDVPPLRARKDDILKLVAYYIRMCRPGYYQDVTISKDVANTLMSHNWRGNIRELKNAIESALADRSINHIDSIDLSDMEDQENECDNDSEDNSKLCTLEEVQKKHILRVLKVCNGNVSSAARILGLERSSISRRLKEYGVDFHDYKA